LDVGDGGWFDWDEDNENHVLDHDVDPAEVEEAMLDPLRVVVHVYSIPGERRRGVVGATDAGRILFVVYTMRGDKVRPVTARDAERPDRRRYRRRRKRA
jgi:uncharacterized DUF497 family protein